MIKSIWIEIRPALSSCQVCITFKYKFASAAKIKLQKSQLVIELNGKSISVNFKDFSVIPLSMTCLKVTNQSLNFRTQIECEFNVKPVVSNTAVPIFENVKTSFSCKCFNYLTREIIFDRVLPLPSNEVDFSHMFCHLHEAPQATESLLEPRTKDCFYSDSFIVVNKEILSGCIIRKKYIRCKRCLADIGVYKKNSVNFWLSALKFPDPYKYTFVQQLKSFIVKAISNPFAVFPIMLFECEETERFLLINIVDKHLIVYSCKKNLVLKGNQVVKLKFNFFSSSNDRIKSLKNDLFNSSISHIQVPNSFVDFAYTYLNSSSKNIPVIFSCVDDECLTYINLTD